MTEAIGAGATGAGRVRLNIGEVLDRLRPDFPGITIPKIRFLEAEGLVTPHRARSGYRTYTDRDIERLRYVLTAQRDRFWPLKVIRDALDAMDRGLTPGEPEGSDARPRVPEGASDPDVPTALALAAPATLRLTARELRDAAGAVVKPTWLLTTTCTVPPVRYPRSWERFRVSATTPCPAKAASPCSSTGSTGKEEPPRLMRSCLARTTPSSTGSTASRWLGFAAR